MYKARVLNMLLYKTKNDADDASMNHGLWTLKEKSDSVPFICNAHTHHKFCRYKHTKHDKKNCCDKRNTCGCSRQWYWKHLTLMQACEPHRTVPPGKQLLGWLVKVTGLTPSCLWRGTGGDQGARRWGKREIIPNATYTVTIRMTPAPSLVVEEGDYT